jgi:3-oxoacyl-[acyl-carrier protein] reductase
MTIYEDLKGRKVLVTGASSGIGAAAAVMFAEQSCFVGVHYFTSKRGAEETLQQVKKHGEGILLQADVRDENQVREMVRIFAEAAGGIDVLVNNAGTMIERQPLETATADYHDQIYAINVRSILLATQAAMPYLRNDKGNIVNIGSLGGHTGGGNGSEIYCASKGAVATVTMGMAREFAKYGIRVNNICPGVVETPFHDKFSTPEFVKSFAERTLLGRNAVAEDVAKVVLFLASNEAAGFITGEYIAVNGGFYMRA